MSLVAMVAAAFGFLPVVAGALLQEAIDVAVILNALRALRGGLERPIRVPGWADTGARLMAEHRALAPGIARLRVVADHLDPMDTAEAREALIGVQAFLVETLVPHEEEEDRAVYPLLSVAMRTDDATAALHRTHTEIFHLVRLHGRIVDEIMTDGPTADDRTDLQRALYGLDAIVRLHMAQEEELYASIEGGRPRGGGGVPRPPAAPPGGGPPPGDPAGGGRRAGGADAATTGVTPVEVSSTAAVASWMTSAVTIPNIPSCPSACGRMWQWNAQAPGILAIDHHVPALTGVDPSVSQ